MVAVLLLLFAVTASASSPTTTDNDGSCDIALAPAATLLLPYYTDENAGTFPGPAEDVNP